MKTTSGAGGGAGGGEKNLCLLSVSPQNSWEPSGDTEGRRSRRRRRSSLIGPVSLGAGFYLSVFLSIRLSIYPDEQTDLEKQTPSVFRFFSSFSRRPNVGPPARLRPTAETSVPTSISRRG